MRLLCILLSITIASVQAAAQPATAPATLPAPAAKLAIPDAAALARAERLLGELYREDLAKRQPAELRSVAIKFIAEASRAASDPTSAYVLLRESRERAAKAGAISVALEAQRKLLDTFDVPPAVTLELIGRFKTGTITPDDAAALTDYALENADDLLEAGLPDQATAAVDLAALYVAKARLTELTTRVQDAKGKLKAAAASMAAAQAARLTLKTAPDDPGANLALGRHLAVFSGNWAEALGHLARAADPAWKNPATAELARPADSDALAQLADQWWDLGMKEPSPAKERLIEHATDLYRRALPDAKGLLQTKIEKRIEESLNLERGGATGAALAVPGFGNMSRSTRLALPTEAEYSRLRQLRPAYQAHLKAFELWIHPYHELYAQVMLRLSAEPETWTEADFAARLDAEIRLVEISGDTSDIHEQLTLLRTPFEVFCGSSPSPEKFKARVMLLDQFWQKRGRRFAAANDFIETRIIEAIETWFVRNQPKYPTFTRRAQFMDWLLPPNPRARRIDDYRQRLYNLAKSETTNLANAKRTMAQVNPVPPQYRPRKAPSALVRDLSELSRSASDRPRLTQAAKDALPSETEIEAYLAMVPGNPGSPQETRRRDVYNKMRQKIWDHSMTWNAADFLARARALDRLEALNKNQPYDPSALWSPNAVDHWSPWAALATSPPEFRQRVLVLENFRMIAAGKDKPTIDRLIESGIARYMKHSPNRPVDKADEKIDLLDYLRTQGVPVAPLDALRENIMFPRDSRAF